MSPTMCASRITAIGFGDFARVVLRLCALQHAHAVVHRLHDVPARAPDLSIGVTLPALIGTSV